MLAPALTAASAAVHRVPAACLQIAYGVHCESVDVTLDVWAVIFALLGQCPACCVPRTAFFPLRFTLTAFSMSETTPLMLGARGRVTLNDPARGLPGRAVPLPKQKPIVLIEDNGELTGAMARSCAGFRLQPSRPPPPSHPRDLSWRAGAASYTTLRKQALVTDLQLRHRDIRALDPAVALPCAHD